MSRASKICVAFASIFTTATVVLVHLQQQVEKTAMHQGVVRDMEQMKIKRERQFEFEAQRDLEKEYKKDQTVKISDLSDIPKSG